jgi:hypothetical protein
VSQQLKSGGVNVVAEWLRRRLRMCLRQVDLLSSAKDSPLPSLRIARYCPQPQRHIERINAERRPKGKFADPMLFCMAGSAQRNGVPIAWLHRGAAIASCSHMRGL